MVERDRETVIVTDGGGGGSGGLIFAVVLIVALIVGVVYFVNVNSGGQGGTVSIDVPAVSVSQ